ncbi:Alpha/beta hydrolase fold-1 [Penicillium hetheringtonii]|uniref:Alpha/beta hydrolase fold-1 n=1 Tax=Penicillium hetheringtonii TaxID=911720 RepID=A0AAD6GWG7_9EURO|nr:Alpha/beta hydrolase fold-1 [Penicillium hetheringtonii]
MDQPTLLFIPGAWHAADGFEDVRASLASRKIKNPTIALLLPSIEKLVEQGKKVVVIAHSSGGMVGAGAVKGHSCSERKQEEKKGGVIMLVYMAAFVSLKGGSLLGMLGGKYFTMDESTGMLDSQYRLGELERV